MAILNKRNKKEKKHSEEDTVRDIFEKKLEKKQKKGLLYFFAIIFFMIGFVFYLFNMQSSELYYLEAQLEHFKVAEISFISYSIDNLNINLFSGNPSTLKSGSIIYLKGHVDANGVFVPDSFSKKIGFKELYMFKGVIVNIDGDTCNIKYKSLPYGLNSNQIKTFNINQSTKNSYGFIGLKIRNHKSYGIRSFSDYVSEK